MRASATSSAPGVIDFFGGVLTAVFAFIYLVKLSVQMTLVTFVILVIFGLILQRAFKTIRPIFRERAKINAEVTGRLTESLGGVRVVKGYHAEESEANVFATGANRLLQNVISSLTAQSLMSLASTAVLGVVGALIMYLGAHQVVTGRLTTGGYVTYVMFLAFMIAPIVQLVSIGTQLTEAVAGLDRTTEIMAENEEDSEPQRTVLMPPIRGDVAFRDVIFSYEPDKPVLHGISFRVQTRHCHRSRWILRLWQVHHHLAHLRLPHSFERTGLNRRRRPCHHPALQLSRTTRRRFAGDLPLRRDDTGKHLVFTPQCHRRTAHGSLPHRARR